MSLRLFQVLMIAMITRGYVNAQDDFIALAELAAVKEVDNLPPQKTPEFLKPLVNLELSFIKRVCEPSDEQMTAIVAEATRAFDAMSNLVDKRQARALGVLRIAFMGPNQERLNASPFHRVRQDAAILLKPLVSEEQYKKYIDETSQRNDFEREAAVVIAIDLIDGKVVLTDQQCVRLFEKLVKSWDQVDFQILQTYHQNPQYLPELPDALIEPILTPAQRVVWTSARQTRVTMYASMTDGAAFGVDEEWIK